jgi:2-keto-4-pentenoate hydratase
MPPDSAGAGRPEHAEIAGALSAAYASGQPIEPITETNRQLSIDDAYAIQMDQVRGWLADGQSLKGHKIGLTSMAMQRMLGVSEPDFGCLTDAMFAAPSSDLPIERFIQPRVEPELSFVLGEDLRPPVTMADVARATAYVIPTLEIIDSRIVDWRIKLVDTVADNASSGAVVLGGQPRPLDAVDLALTGCNLTVNGEIVATGATGAVLGNPMAAVVWLANTLARHGVSLSAGQVVLSGACTVAVPAGPGDVVSAEFMGMGVVTARFSNDGGAA